MQTIKNQLLWVELQELSKQYGCGSSQGFEKKLELVGVGYRAKASGKILDLTLGFSHPIKYELLKV